MSKQSEIVLKKFQEWNQLNRLANSKYDIYTNAVNDLRSKRKLNIKDIYNAIDKFNTWNKAVDHAKNKMKEVLAAKKLLKPKEIPTKGATSRSSTIHTLYNEPTMYTFFSGKPYKLQKGKRNPRLSPRSKLRRIYKNK